MPLNNLLKEIQGTAKEVKKHLLGLIKAKILTKTSKGRTLFPDDIIAVNTKYAGKLIRIQLEVISTEVELDKEKLVESVDDNRKYFLEAALVKIMKARRTLDHASLITEAIKLSQLRFVPDIKMIKDRIEALIEKEFIRRDQGSGGLYHYIT